MRYYFSDELLIEALTTSPTVTRAAERLGVSYTWLYLKAKRLEKKGLIVHRTELPIYLPADRTPVLNAVA